MATIIMLVGMPASGKSTWAEMNAEKLNAVVLSSDKYREVMFGDASIQGDPTKIFEKLYKDARLMLNNGVNVIIDATNVSRKRRIAFNKDFKKYIRKVVYFSTSPYACEYRDKEPQRGRTVGKDVINKMFKSLSVPTYSEGWSHIDIVYDEFIKPFSSKDSLEQMLLNDCSYEQMFHFPSGLCQFGYFTSIYDMPQDNPHHTFSVSRHIHHVYKYVYENYDNNSKDFIKMLWMAVFHDVGKGYTKTFTNYEGEPTRFAHYYNHEFVSGQIACHILHSLGYDNDFVLDVVELVQLHMKLIETNERAQEKLKQTVGEDIFAKLQFFRSADTSAK